MASTRHPVDLEAAAVVTVGAVLAGLVDAPIALQMALGLPMVLLVPGYVILALTHPGAGADLPLRRQVRALPMVDRLALSPLLSIAAVVAVGVALNLTPAGLTRSSFLLALGAATSVGLALALAVRLLDTPEDRRPTFHFGAVSLTRPWHELVSLAALVGAVVFLIGAAFVFGSDAADDSYVSLFVEPNFRVECYPLQFAAGAYHYNATGGKDCEGTPDNLTYVINNHGRAALDYTLVIFWSQDPGPEVTHGDPISQAEGHLDALSDTGTLAHQLQQPLPLPPPPYRGLQYLKIQLFRGEATGVPEHALQLRVDAP